MTLTTNESILKIENLQFGYQNSGILFNNLNLQLNPGNIYGLLGKNGVGKTTLLRLIAGLLIPKHGNCLAFDQYVPENRQAMFLKDIYFLPEEFYMPAISIACYCDTFAPFYQKFDKMVFNNCIKEFDLIANKNLTALSYGQKKKVLIAFAIATNCKLILLDEPTNGLDIPSKSQFRKLLASAINEEKTFVISTHQVRDLENLIDPIIILNNGEIIFNYSIEDITKHLAFENQTEIPNPLENFYYEKNLAGYRTVNINKSNHETQIDLEMLFNAVLANQDRMKQLFTGETHAK